MQTSKPVVLITPQIIYENEGPHLPLLREAGFDVRLARGMKMTTEAETIAGLRAVAATIAAGEPYTDHVFANLPDLRVTARAGVGYEHVDLDAATRHGVVVTITPRANHESVAEQTLALLLALARGIVRQDREVHRGFWSKAPVDPLRDKTLGIAGLGRIGRSVAVRAAAFRLKLLAFEQYPDRDFVRRHGIELVDLEALLARSDYLTLHLPMSNETRGMINRRTLALMKPGGYLINTARGGLIVEEDLAAALQAGHLAGAGLDVFAKEPTPADNPLLKLDNVIATPHMAGTDTCSTRDMALHAAEYIVDLYQGRWPGEAVVNPAVRQGWRWQRG